MSAMIALSDIAADDRLRTLDPDWVETLASDIAQHGQTEPIVVSVVGDGQYHLVHGKRRMAALAALQRTEVWAVWSDSDATTENLRLAEVKAQLLRGDLTALDRAVHIAMWRDLHEAENGRAKPGPRRGQTLDEADEESSANFALNFSEAAQRALGISRRSVFNALKIAQIDEAVRGDLALRPIAKVQRDLLNLAGETPTRQRGIADLLIGDEPQATSYAEAIALLDSVPATAPTPPHEKIQERFVRLQKAQRERFYELNREEIEAWLAEARRPARKAA